MSTPTELVEPAPAAEGGGRRRGRARTEARRRWQAVVLLVAAACVLPIALVVLSLLNPSREVWAFLLETGLGSMALTTVALGVVVVLGATVLGAGLAWLVGRYTFPGQRLFSWLLVLPLAVPAYVSGFVYIGLLDHPGPVQSGLRALFGPDVWFPQVRSFWLCALVLVMAYYPYTYILARAALREQSETTYQAARSLGAGPLSAARRVVLPLARPALAAGGMVVAMETLTDFATVQYFGVRTVSVGVHQVWVGMYDRVAASELAGVVMLFALAVIAAERVARGGARFHQHGGGRPLGQVRLTGGRAVAATGTCLAVLAITVGVPLVQLLAWSRPSETDVGLDSRFLGYVGSSALVAVVVSLICAAIGLLLAGAVRLGGGRATPWLARAATIGYAVPGPVVAIGVLIILSALDGLLDVLHISLGTSLVTGTLAGLIYAYVVRFLALAWSSVDAGMEQVSPSITDAALALGERPGGVLRRVHLPLLRPGLGVALVLVAVDALKELPIMLLLRPFGFETLAVWVNQLATESRWHSAGPPALTIVAIATVPIILVFRRTLAIPRKEDLS
ncbi:iron ABC transporter permease [Marihabitans asiaticum]|uniref:Iron(III) transport system permease protein n=1 Tax=Marihabitans asiaticum TaxID=415218 RepID=A0A560WE66_9MICO|nr:iron ABC transporter permease [Marihabitans asiaticum]TWD15830.1 iron(III) transport system permease protein [Marihabitans asiaticum]